MNNSEGPAAINPGDEDELSEYIGALQRERLLRRSEGAANGYRRHIFSVLLTIPRLVVSLYLFLLGLLQRVVRLPSWMTFRVPYILLLPWADHVLFRLNIGWRGGLAGMISWILCNYVPLAYVGPMCLTIPILSVLIPSPSLGLAMLKCLGMFTASLWVMVSSLICASILIAIPDTVVRNTVAGGLIALTTFCYLLHVDHRGQQITFMINNTIIIVLVVFDPSGQSLYLPFYGVYAMMLTTLLGLLLTVLPVPVMAYGALVRNPHRNLRLSTDVFALVAKTLTVAPSHPQLARTILARAETVLQELKESVDQYEEDMVFASTELWFCRLNGFGSYLRSQRNLVSLLELILAKFRAVQWNSASTELGSAYLGQPTTALAESLSDMVDPLGETLVHGFHLTPFPYFARNFSSDVRLQNHSVESIFRRRWSGQMEEETTLPAISSLVEELELEMKIPISSNLNDGDFWRELMNRVQASASSTSPYSLDDATRSALSLGASIPTLKALTWPTSHSLNVFATKDRESEPVSVDIESGQGRDLQGGNVQSKKKRAPANQRVAEREDLEDAGTKNEENDGSSPTSPRKLSSSSSIIPLSPLMENMLKYENAYLELRRDRFSVRADIPWTQETHLSLLSVQFLVFYFVRTFADLSSTSRPTLSASLSLDSMYRFLFPLASYLETQLVEPLWISVPAYLASHGPWARVLAPSLAHEGSFRDLLTCRGLRKRYPVTKILGSAQVAFALVLSTLTLLVPPLGQYFEEGLWAVLMVALYMVRDSEAGTFSNLGNVIIGTLYGTVVSYFSLLFVGNDLLPLGVVMTAVCFVCTFIMADSKSKQAPVADAALGTSILLMFRGAQIDLSSTETLKAVALTRIEAVAVGLLIVVLVSLLRPQFVRLALRKRIIGDLQRVHEQLRLIVQSAVAAIELSVHPSEWSIAEQTDNGESVIRLGLVRSRAVLAEVIHEPRILKVKFPETAYGRMIDATGAMLRALVLLSRAVRVSIYLQPKIMRVLSDLLVQYEALFASRVAALMRLVDSPHSGTVGQRQEALCSDGEFYRVHIRLKRLVMIMFARFHVSFPIWMRASVGVDIVSLHALLESENQLTQALADFTEATTLLLIQIMDS